MRSVCRANEPAPTDDARTGLVQLPAQRHSTDAGEPRVSAETLEALNGQRWAEASRWLEVMWAGLRVGVLLSNHFADEWVQHFDLGLRNDAKAR
jgi:hypothetical protein